MVVADAEFVGELVQAVKATGAAGFFVISAVAAAADAEKAAREMVAQWNGTK